MTGALAIAARAGDGLAGFAYRALARGRQQFLASPMADRVTVRLAGRSMTVAESARHLAPWIADCLDSVSGDVKKTPDVSVFIDYFGSHLGVETSGIFAAGETMLSVDQRLRDMGLRGAFTERLQLCDIFDPVQGFGIRLQAGPAATPPWEPTAPLAFFGKWIAEMQGLTMVHAASLAQSGVGALLVGNGGAGKSGTVLGGLLSGFQSAGDDYVLVSTGATAQAHAIYRSVKQDNAGLIRLGLPPSTKLNWQNKAVFRPETMGARRIHSNAPIHVILLPKTGADRTSFRPIDPAGVFKTLAISTLKQIGGGAEQMFQACAALVRDRPCFAMNLSPDPREVARELGRFLRGQAC